MAQRTLFRPFEMPFLGRKSTSVAFVGALTTQIDAADEQVHYVGYVMLEDPTGGNKTISSAGGKIHWRPSQVTFADAGTTLRVGIEDVSTTTSPAQGDGTADVFADLVGGTDTLADTYTITAMGTGSKVLSHGQLVAVSFNLVSKGGADVIATGAILTDISTNQRSNMPGTMRKVAGNFSVVAQATANVGIEFDDGTVGWLSGGEVTAAVGSVVVNLDTATADEYGNLIQLSTPMTVTGISTVLTLASAASDFEALLYSDPLGTPVVLASVVVDATQMGSPSIGHYEFLFSTPVVLRKDTPYAVCIRPTTVNDVTIQHQDYGDVRFNKLNTLDGNAYAVRRIDNTGAFADYNGGTAKTRVMQIAALIQGIANDDGNGEGSSPTGFSNSELGL